MSGWREVLACDLRSLALMRVGLGLALLVDLAQRLPGLRAHYTDAGLLPRALLSGPEGMVPSLYLLGGSSAWAGALFALAALAAVGLALGYRTRWMAFVSWLLLVSLHARHPALAASADRLLAVLLLLAWFAPCAARYSVDAALAAALPPATDRSPASAVLSVQVTAAFFVSGLAAAVAGPLPAWGYAAMAASLLLVCPWRASVARLAAMLVLGLAAVAASGPGALGWLAPAVALAALLPGAVWPVLQRWLAARASPRQPGVLHIYYDRDCGFCFKTCLLLRTFLVLGEVPITPAQSVPAVHRLMQERNTWVVYDHDGSAFIRWHAVLLLVRRSPLFWPLGRLAAALGMGTWADGLYTLVAANRGRLSSLTRRLLALRALPGGSRAREIAIYVWAALAVLALVLDLAGAARTGEWQARAHPARGQAALAAALGLSQHWRLFDPAAPGGIVIGGPAACRPAHERGGLIVYTAPLDAPARQGRNACNPERS